MTHLVEPSTIDVDRLREVCSVIEFSRRYRLEPIETQRLRKLFGEFATKQELLMNCRRQLPLPR